MSYVVSEVYVHNEYNKANFMNDMALLRVESPILLNAYTSIACLPQPDNDDYDVNEGSHCIAVGWGNMHETGDPSEHLQQVEIPIYEKCTKSYQNDTYQICGGKIEGGVDTCQGDSGGPLYCKTPGQANKWYLAGVISNGLGCARPEEPGAYVRVSEYLDYIETTTKLTPILVRNPNNPVVANTKCPTYVCDGLCIQKHLLCNDIVDCFENSGDEIHCRYNSEGVKVFTPPSQSTEAAVGLTQTTAVGPVVLYPFREPPRTTCPDNHFQCESIPQCIPEEKTCNFNRDCVDHSDEHGCTCADYLKKLKPNLLCDGYPDCPFWEDEKNCHECKYEQFYCDLSEQCVDKKKVCDRKIDCKFGEDERYCFALFTSDSISIKKDGRPLKPSKGLLAINVQGHWTTVCSKTWSKDYNNRICRYMNFKTGKKFQTVPTSTSPFLKNRILRTRNIDGHTIFPRSAEDQDVDERTTNKNGECRFVDIECNEHPTCGVMPFYSNPSVQIPKSGRGVFPWQVTLYKNGFKECGATLVHRHWILTHSDCVQKFDMETDTIVARAGGYREQITKSYHDQYQRVLYFSAIPKTNTVLGLLQVPFELNEFVNTICIPNNPWVPYLKHCYISGHYEERLNHVYQTKVLGICDYKSDHEYYFCTNQTTKTSECLNKWSGALVCPDETGTFFAVGVYHSERGNCGFGQEPAPNKFQTLVSNAVRNGILAIMESVKLSDLNNLPAPNTCPTTQCMNGKCLLEEKVCDYYPDCPDLSDESEASCNDRVPPMCQVFNSTHCQCQESQLLCNNGMCLDKSKFCDTRDDCRDGTDEPDNCQNDCPGYLSVIEPSKVCNGNVDCNGVGDIGTDESAKLCCNNETLQLEDGQYPYRCAIGPLSVNSYSQAVISDECINSKGVCDWDIPVPGSTVDASCGNGADERDCVNIWPSLKIGNEEDTRDPFGRYKTNRVGYLYFVAFGKKYLYCAGPDTWSSQYTKDYGRILCQNEGFPGLSEIQLFVPVSRTRVGLNDIVLQQPEQSNYERCLLVYITCHDKHFKG